MDLGMPIAQREAWNKLKKAANDYAVLTGNEVAVVTAYIGTSNTQTVDNSSESLSFYGHGGLLQRVQNSLDRSKIAHSRENSSSSSLKNGWSSSPSADIPIRKPIGNGEQTHHSQAMARSLCSSFRSLKLGDRNNAGFTSDMNSASLIGQTAGYPITNSNSNAPNRRGGKRSSRKKSNRTVNGGRKDNFELDENLLFDEPSNGTSEEEDDDFDDDSDDSTDFSENSFGRPSNFPPPQAFHRPPALVQPDQNQFATSLPVNISSNWGQRHDGLPHFRDNQGPHPPLHRPPQQTAQVPQVINQSSRPFNQSSQDTPNPETMMASIQALARSVTDDTALIFGERPRPRLNTGESRMTHIRR